MVVTCKTISGWKLIKIPEDIKFEIFHYLIGYWKWNEEYQLLIDPFNVIRKADKDVFLRYVGKYQSVYMQTSNKISGMLIDQLELFNHWYDEQENRN